MNYSHTTLTRPLRKQPKTTPPEFYKWRNSMPVTFKRMEICPVNTKQWSDRRWSVCTSIPQSFSSVHQFPDGTRSARFAPLLVVSARFCAAVRTGECPNRSAPPLVQRQWSSRASLCVWSKKKKKKTALAWFLNNLTGGTAAFIVQVDSLVRSWELGLCPAE